jgi:hypothetical protein
MITEYSTEWQGRTLPVHWEEAPGVPEETPARSPITADDDQLSGNDLGPLVEVQRLPPAVFWLTSPTTWTLEEMLTWHEHIHAGQQGLLPADQRFQFSWTDTGEVEEEFQTMAHPWSQLWYDGRSRLWVV